MSFHDEPLVFDNEPFGMDIGQSHAEIPGLFVPVPDTNNWLRKASDPSRIMVLVKKANGEVEEFKLTALDTHEGPVTVTLKVPSVTPNPTVVLTWGGLTRDELTIAPAPVGFTLQRNGASRRLKPSIPSTRIAKIEWRVDHDTTDSVDLTDGAGGFRHHSVFVALI